MTLSLTVSQTATRSTTVTAEMVRSYAKITGGFNPLHFDKDFSRSTRFGRLIAQGGLATGLLHALVAMNMPGPGSVFTTQSWTFPKPVYIGDTIRAEATVVSVPARLPMTDLELVVTNQDGEVVLKGTTTVYQAAPAAPK